MRLPPAYHFLAIACVLLMHGASAQQDSLRGDSVLHRYINGAVSVAQTPWHNGRSTLKLYDLKGELIFTIEEVRLSFTVSAELDFHKNGVVKTAIVTTNPGASRYMHQSEITFSSTNQPLWKTDRQIPADAIEAAAGERFYWHKREKRWVKQEIAICDPPRK